MWNCITEAGSQFSAPAKKLCSSDSMFQLLGKQLLGYAPKDHHCWISRIPSARMDTYSSSKTEAIIIVSSQMINYLKLWHVPLLSPFSSKDTGPSLLGSMSLSSSSPSPASYSETKTASSGSLLNGPLSYSQPPDSLKVRMWRHNLTRLLKWHKPFK